MSTELPVTPLSPEERIKRQKDVRRVVLIRGFLLGLIIAGWWIFFAPDTMMERDLKIILGVVVGFLATGSYLFNLRDALFLRAGATPGKQGAAE